MAQIGMTELKPGVKVELENQPYVIVSNEFVKPGKGQAFNRVRLKHLTSGRTIDRTFKSGEKVTTADVLETEMRMLYKESDGIFFMDDATFEQIKVPLEKVGEALQWMMEDLTYEILLYKGEIIAVQPPTFIEMKITESEPGLKGDTASGRVMKSAITETGAKVQIPLFIEVGEIVKIDTRTGSYVSRV